MKKAQTFGDARSILLETIIDLRSGKFEVSRGEAITNAVDALTRSIQVEINAAKLSLQATAAGKDFGDVMRLGTRKIFDGELIEE